MVVSCIPSFAFAAPSGPSFSAATTTATSATAPPLSAHAAWPIAIVDLSLRRRILRLAISRLSRGRTRTRHLPVAIILRLRIPRARPCTGSLIGLGAIHDRTRRWSIAPASDFAFLGSIPFARFLAIGIANGALGPHGLRADVQRKFYWRLFESGFPSSSNVFLFLIVGFVVDVGGVVVVVVAVCHGGMGGDGGMRSKVRLRAALPCSDGQVAKGSILDSVRRLEEVEESLLLFTRTWKLGELVADILFLLEVVALLNGRQ
mmetsp:Transcript_21058/g.43735  ORF Transcript_21058/g.43735 Transcript_21058/m.43735 type:complete len:261 (-) Transcript_21058:47-829(-)